jgi:serine phosphatase RsbU (regulator of sigma subunit)
VVVDPDGTARLLTSEPDLLLGVDARTSRHQHRTVLEPGATLVLYTDGLVESRVQTLDDGLDRLLGRLNGVQDHALEVLCDEMLAAAPDSDDDVALLLLRS